MTLRRAAIPGLAALCLVAGVSAAAAQTVIVKNAPEGSHVELVLNAETVASATADVHGSASLTVPKSANAKEEMDTNVFVDVCGDNRRVLIVERVQAAAPEQPDCVRREVVGVFLVRPTSTVVVDVKGPTFTLLLRQGRYTPTAPRSGEAWNALALRGLTLSAGGDFTVFQNSATDACGSGANCKGDGSSMSHTFAAAYWLLPFLAADVTYLKAGKLVATGFGDTYRFNSTLDADVLTIGGLVGAPVGQLRIYGKAGMNYHWGAFSTTETTDEITMTVDGVDQVIPGGTQSMGYRTAGWGYMFGAGTEMWLARPIAVYGEVGWNKLKGKDRDGGEGALNDTLLTIQFGVRFHLGR